MKSSLSPSFVLSCCAVSAWLTQRMQWLCRQGLVACVGAVLATAALAERADRTQPMNAEADALRYDDARQLSVFTGNVVITKGTIVIRGDRVEVRQDAQGNQFGLVTGSPANPAFFRQKREGLDEHIEGTADQIDYNGQADQVKFIGSAVLRRYRGAVLGDETAGGLIVYNNSNETFSVDAGASGRTAANPSGRVRAMLTPASAMNPPAAATGQPAATATTPAPATPPARLAPSGRLDGVGR
jgi:lipopolysaccharide export system protein LptA